MTPKRFWLTRCGDGECSGCYNVHSPRPKLSELNDRGHWQTVPALLFTMCADRFETATGIKLKPGGGPVPVTLLNRNEYEVERP